MHVGGRLGVITIHHKGRFLISHTLISFCLQIAFQSPVMCVRAGVRVALSARINTNVTTLHTVKITRRRIYSLKPSKFQTSTTDKSNRPVAELTGKPCWCDWSGLSSSGLDAAPARSKFSANSC